ncbi:ACDC domain-containing protein [Plasmodium yoelii yoelii]|uniref:ACDC domain-containing protein n=1 Tax=Plasmodium yoelii yoelii TaxID=73239 RepID=A0AAE9WYW0_PLAYO|nr:ACDC domain-containing protein [Plasmodium yoelii yoelii]
MNLKNRRFTNLSIERYTILKKKKRNDEKYIKIYEKINSVGKRNNFNSKIFRYTNNKRSTNKSINMHNIDNNIKDTIQDIIKVNTYYNALERNKYYTSVDENKQFLSQSEEDFCMQNNMNIFCNEQDILKTNNVMENESMENNNSKNNNDDIKINNNYNHINIINANNKNINTNISMINIPITCSALKKYIYYDMSNSKKENSYIIKNEKDTSNTFDHTENQRCNDMGVENKYATSYDENYENCNENSSSNCHVSSSGSDKWNCNSHTNETYNKNNLNVNEITSSQLECQQNIFHNNCKEEISNKKGCSSLELCTNLEETCEDNYSEDRENGIENGIENSIENGIIIKETFNNEDISESEASKTSTMKKTKEICKNIYVPHRKGSDSNVKIKKNKKKDTNFKEKIDDLILCKGENLSNEIIEEHQKSEKNTISDNCSPPFQMENIKNNDNNNNNNILCKQTFDASIGKSTTNTYCELSDRMLTATTSAEKSSENLSNTNNEQDEKVYSNSPLNNPLYNTYLHLDPSSPLSDILCNDICHKNDDRIDNTNDDMTIYVHQNNMPINTNNTTINPFNSNNSGNVANIVRKDKLDESPNENGKKNGDHNDVSKNETNLHFSCEKNFNDNDEKRNKDMMINEMNFYDKKKTENGEIIIKKENIKRNLNCDLDQNSKKKLKINEYSVINLNTYKNHQYDIYKNNSYNAYILKNLRNAYLRNKLKEQQGLGKVKKQGQGNKLDKNVEKNLSYDNCNNKIVDNNDDDDDESFYYESNKFTINQDVDKENYAINKKNDKNCEQIKGMDILENVNVKDEIITDTHNSNNINTECVPSICSEHKNPDRKNHSLKGLNFKKCSNTNKGSYDPKFVNENLLRERKEKYNNTNLNLCDIINLLEKEKIENLYSENELKYILFPIYDIYYDNKNKNWVYKIENEKNTLNDKENKKNVSTKNSSYHKSRQLALERKYNHIKERYNIFANLSEEENIFFISINMHIENDQVIKNKTQNSNEESTYPCFKGMESELKEIDKDDIFNEKKNINTKEQQTCDQENQPNEIEEKNKEYTNSSNEHISNINEVLNNKDYNINKENLTETIKVLNNEVPDKTSIPLLLPIHVNENKSNISYNGIETSDKTTENNISSEDNIENGIISKSKECFVSKKENNENSNVNDKENLKLSEKSDDKMFNCKTESILYNVLGIRLSNNVIEKMRNLQKQNIFYERDKKRWVIKILEKETNTLLYFKKFDCKVFGFLYACILTIEYKKLYLDYFLNEKNYDFLMKLIHNNYIKKNTYYNTVTQPTTLYNDLQLKKNNTPFLNSIQENQLNVKDNKTQNNQDNSTYEETSLLNANYFSSYNLEENKTHSNLHIEKKKKKNSDTLILNNDTHDLYNQMKNIENKNVSSYENQNLLNDVDCANYKKGANMEILNGCNLEGKCFSSNRQESENKETCNTEIQNYEMSNIKSCNSDVYSEHDCNNGHVKDGVNFIEHMQLSENGTKINNIQSREIIKDKKQKTVKNVKDVNENFTAELNGVQMYNGNEKKKKKKNYSLSINKNNGNIKDNENTNEILLIYENEVYAPNNDVEKNLIEDNNISEVPKPNDTTNNSIIISRNETDQTYNEKINNHKKANENIKKSKKVKNSSVFKKTKNMKDTSPNLKENNNNNNYTSELALEETNNLIKLDSYVDNLERNSDVISLAKLTILLLLKDIINCIPSQMAPSVISRKIYDQKINAHVKFVYQCKSLIELMPYFFIFKNIIKQKTLPSDQSLYICNVLLYALFEA